jgi:protein arginine kinase
MIADAGLDWLSGTGPHADLVVSTRIRLARNVAGRPFWGRNTPADRERIVRLVESAAEDAGRLAGATWHRLDTLARPSRMWLHERQLASRELAGLEPGGKVRSGAAVLAGEEWAVLCNEEDHLRIHALAPGLSLEPAYASAERVDAELGRRISFAFHPEFGYLTGCPTNVGTGLRASVLIHLPALVLTREAGKILQGLAQVGLTHRGLWGEGSEVRGNLFQLSNQVTLGRSESELLEHLGRLVEEVMGHEARAREVLRRDAPMLVEDRVWRAWGLLRSARVLHYDELLNLLSGVRLGVGMDILPPLGWHAQNRLLVVAQDAHLARSVDIGLDDEALPVHRAALVRRMLDGEMPG